MDQDEFGEIENDDLNNEEFNYEEDLMGGDDQQIPNNQLLKKEQDKNPISNQITHTPQPPEEEEEGEVYEYEDQSEGLVEDNNNEEDVEQEVNEEVPEDNDDQYNEEENEEEQYNEDYEQNEYQQNDDESDKEQVVDISNNNQQNKEIKDNKNNQSNQPTSIMEPPKQKKRPPLPTQPIKQKPTYQEKYAELMAQQDYSNWKPKQLHDENKQLRQKLKEISDEVSKLVEQNAQRLPPQPQPQPSMKRQKTAQSQVSGGTVIDKEIEINQKKLEQQEEEINKLNNRIQQIQQINYIMKLDEEIKKFEEEMKKLEQRKKQEFLQQKQRGKDLDKYENQDGFDKLNKERNSLNQEMVNLRRKIKEQQEQLNKQKENIKNTQEVELPKINKELKLLEEEAEKYKIDISGDKPFSKLKEQYIALLAQKDNLLKHNLIMEKKDKQLEMIEKEIKELKKEKERFDQQINANEMILIDQRRQKEELKVKVPSDVFKSIPATMTQENISEALQQEKKTQENQRKLQSAKPPISKQQQDQSSHKELKLPVKQDEKPQQLTSKNEVEEEIICEDETEQQKQPIKQEEKKQIQISQSTPIKQDIQIIQQQLQSPNQQNKLNSKPFNNIRKSVDQQPTTDLGLNNESNQQNNINDVQIEYTGPSRIIRMMRKPQQNQQEDTPQFIINPSKPVEQPRDQHKEINEQNNNKPIEQPTQFEQPKPIEDYQPTFPTRRTTNRPRGLDHNTNEQQQTIEQPIQINQKQDQTQQSEYPTRRRMRVGQDEQQEQQNNNQQQQQSQQQSISSQQQSLTSQQQSYQPSDDGNKQRRIKIFTDEKQPEAPKTEEPTNEFQTKQEPNKQQGRRNRGNNKLNIWEDQPVQKENIEEIQEIKDIKQVPEVQHKEDRELTLDEILGAPKHQEEYRPNQQKRKFEVPKDDSETYEPGFGGGGNKRGLGNQQKIDKQKELAQKAEKGDLLDDFDF
ncbi:unnamed protein product [Paramecium pentaurelia]|uniref:Uncharacterized protein n=1 Tax=Paramecium pentaurelia TaxID=43138 RepID=A0A8S1UYQ5_9CILI|nr:unnamed protein product [Paramecium pentaurelia]